jgi:putative MFS transporter
MDRLPMSAWHYKIVILITAGLFIDAFELYSGGGVLAALVQSGWSTIAVNASFVSVTLAGLVGGAWLAGILGDRFGRRFCYQANLALFGFASIAGAFAPNIDVLIVCRFFMGLGLGAEIVVGYGTLVEFLPKTSRGKVMTAIAMIVNFSFFLSLVTAYFVIPALGWRAMFLIPGLAAIGIWFARKSMPESPRWLESKGRVADANELLAQIEQQVSGGRPLSAFEPVEAHVAPVTSQVLFSPGVRRNTLVGILINITVNFSLYGFLQWLPTVFVNQGMTLGSALQISMVLALGKTVGALGGTLLTDRIGRKSCIVSFSSIGAVIGAVMVYTHGITFILTAFVLAVCLGLANTIAFTVYVPELFETRFRLRGAGLCGAIGRLSSSGVQYIIPPILAVGGLSGITFTLSGTLLLQAAIVGIFGIETRQKALDNPEVSAAEPKRKASEMPLKVAQQG